MSCFCCFFHNILSSQIFWTAISAIATTFLGYFAYQISREQLIVSLHKKDDFLYSYRLELYLNYRYTLEQIIEELLKSNNNKNGKIDEKFIKSIYKEIVKMCHSCPFLFGNKLIENNMRETLNDLRFLFGVNGTKQAIGDEQNKIIKKLYDKVETDKLTTLFYPYLKI